MGASFPGTLRRRENALAHRLREMLNLRRSRQQGDENVTEKAPEYRLWNLSRAAVLNSAGRTIDSGVPQVSEGEFGAECRKKGEIVIIDR